MSAAARAPAVVRANAPPHSRPDRSVRTRAVQGPRSIVGGPMEDRRLPAETVRVRPVRRAAGCHNDTRVSLRLRLLGRRACLRYMST